MHVLTLLTRVKLQKLAYACTVACNFDMYTLGSEHAQYMRDACHKLVLGLPHNTCQDTCGVATRTVAGSNEIQLFCS